MDRRALLTTATGGLLLPALTGCLATAPRSKKDDQNVSSVQVCSLFDPRIAILTIGLTVFGNKFSLLDPNSRLNALFESEMQDTIKRSRPQWKVATTPDRQQLDARIIAFGKHGTFQFQQAQPELRALIERSQSELMFVIAPQIDQYTRSPGLYIEHPKELALPTIGSRVYVLNRDLKVINQRALFTIGFNDVVRPRVKVTSDLHSAGPSEDKLRAVEATLDYGVKSVRSALTILGYGDA